ncbi:AMIN domain-containing protein [Desulfonatronum thiodismutans]|uniref:AMIN domain-containing protein n=1 Tax=Desulfonatronum thiodismutans TaxID=159290 RepID=UPI000689288E|nr:AMIN domain-containing protein [Desulfonatronum thiodismutans]
MTNQPSLRSFCALAVLALLLLPTPALPSSPAQVFTLELTPGHGQQVLAVALSQKPHSIHTFELGNPARLVMDISPARLPGGKHHIPTDHDLFHGIRAAQFTRQTVRVVLDLNQDALHLVTSRPVAGDQAQHLILVSLLAPEDAAVFADAQPKAPLSPPASKATEQQDPSLAPILHDARSQTESKTPPTQKIILFGDPQTQVSSPDTAQASPWGRMEASGFIMAKGAQELRESSDSQPRTFRNTIRVEGKWTPPTSAAGLAATGSSTTFLLASIQSDYLRFGPDPTWDEHDLELYEGYLFRGAPGWDMRLGRQIVRWGKADQLSPVDNLNPQDLREFIIPDLEDRKIPNWMARVRLFPGAFTLEGIVVPFFEADRFDYSGTKWALLGIDQPGVPIQETKPARNLGNADWGARSAVTMAGWDVALSYLYAWEKSPRLEFSPEDPQGPALRADHHRQHIVGLEFETALDKFGFRGEGAYFHEQSLQTRNLQARPKPVAQYVLGLDYLGEQDWYANIQFSHQHVFNHEPGLLAKRDSYFLNGEVNREFWRGNITLKLGYALDLQDGGSFLTPEAILTYFKNLELSLGVNLFSGSGESLFGPYKDNDQAFFKAKYYF